MYRRLETIDGKGIFERSSIFNIPVKIIQEFPQSDKQMLEYNKTALTIRTFGLGQVWSLIISTYIYTKMIHNTWVKIFYQLAESKVRKVYMNDN